jgi:hypothetical protein
MTVGRIANTSTWRGGIGLKVNAATAAWVVGTAMAVVGAAQPLPEDLISDRPDFTESASTVSPGRVQLEAGYGFARDEGEDAHDLGQALLRVGLGRDLELRVGLGSFVDAGPASGWDGGSVGLKVRLLDNWGLRPELAVLLGAATPFGDEEVADDAWQPEAKVAAAWELTERLGLSVNGGWARLGDGDGRFDQAQWSASLGVGVTDRLGVFGEYFGASREEPDGEATHYLDGGATWRLGDDLQLDAYGGAGLTGESADWFVGTGVVARW